MKMSAKDLSSLFILGKFFPFSTKYLHTFSFHLNTICHVSTKIMIYEEILYTTYT